MPLNSMDSGQHNASVRPGIYTVINGRGRKSRSLSETAPDQQAIETTNRFHAFEGSLSYQSLAEAAAGEAPTITAPPDPGDVFRAPARVERRERRRANNNNNNGPRPARRVITGRRQSGAGQFRGATEAGRDLFVYRVHADTVEADVQRLVTNVGYTVLNIECVSNPMSKYKSFKLTVPVSQYPQVYNESFPWPASVMVMKFVPPARSRS